ncbi:MAG: hypothetical protein P8010_13805, partial [Desulfosarcinaceae bacterium]
MPSLITDRVMKHFSRIKVVHHLPGRLRLQIPLLERLDPPWQRYEADLIDLIKIKEGLIDGEWSILSGRALIRYDHHRIDKGAIMQWLRKLTLKLYSDFLEAPPESRRQLNSLLKKV